MTVVPVNKHFYMVIIQKVNQKSNNNLNDNNEEWDI